jgi:hypothetical protein
MREGKATASMSCPACGDVGSLFTHEIAPDGIVKPSVLCNRQGCDYHQHIRLAGWTGRK